MDFGQWQIATGERQLNYKDTKTQRFVRGLRPERRPLL